MIKFLVVVTLVWILYQYEKRFMLKEGHDERGKMIFYKARSRAFTYVLIGWLSVYLVDNFYPLTYTQFKNAIVIIIAGIFVIQFIYLSLYRRKY